MGSLKDQEASDSCGRRKNLHLTADTNTFCDVARCRCVRHAVQAELSTLLDTGNWIPRESNCSTVVTQSTANTHPDVLSQGVRVFTFAEIHIVGGGPDLPLRLPVIAESRIIGIRMAFGL